MEFLTNDKLVIVGAAGMIGSNMAQTALMMGLTSNLCLYDVFSPEGVAEEMRQSGFDNVNITATTNVAEAFKDAKYIISSGGAPRCLLYTSDAADDMQCVDLGGRRIIKKNFFKQKTAYEISECLVGSEMCIRDR